jgi:membrane fusion protein, multidrug efflux system
MRYIPRAAFFLLIVPLTVFLCGCGKSKEVVPPPPPQVTVSPPLQKEITDYAIFSGQTSAIEAAEIRARVEGWLEKINFVPGSIVNVNDPLLEIDPRPFQAQVDQNKAVLEAAKADRNLADVNLARSKQLLEKDAVSQLQYDEAKAKALVAGAQVGIAEANLEKANLDLAYTQVKAPIKGRVSRNYVDVGNLVGAREKTLLTKIVDTSNIYFYFDLSERDYLSFRRALPQGPEDKDREGTTVHLQLADESGYPHKGKTDFAEPELDPNTGTLQARAIFDNKDGILTAGLFGRIRIPIRDRNRPGRPIRDGGE